MVTCETATATTIPIRHEKASNCATGADLSAAESTASETSAPSATTSGSA